MADDITLFFREEYLEKGEINLITENYEKAGQNDVEAYDERYNTFTFFISVHRDTGDVIRISAYDFTTEIHNIIKDLRDYPLPWTFSLPSMNIKEKPLEDVLLAIWKKHRNKQILK